MIAEQYEPHLGLINPVGRMIDTSGYKLTYPGYNMVSKDSFSTAHPIHKIFVSRSEVANESCSRKVDSLMRLLNSFNQHRICFDGSKWKLDTISEDTIS